MNSDIKVVKSDGSKVDLNLDKIHKMVEKSCRGITGVSESLVEMNSGLQFYDGITTKEIQKILVKSASDLISLESPNYQFVASRLLLFAIQKQVFNTKWKDSEIYPPLYDIIQRNINIGVYDADILNWYSEEEIRDLDKYIKHGRDYDFTYAGLQQIVDKYLVQDRSSGDVFETPQFMYMLIAMTLFKNYGEELGDKLNYVKRYYDAISQFKINIPTPVMAGVRTPLRQFASCVLVDSDDTLGSIFSSDIAIGKYVDIIEDNIRKLDYSIQQVSGLTQEEYEALGQRLEVVKFNIQELSHSLKSLSQLLDVALKMVSEVEVQLSTFQYGTKKSKTSLSSKITRALKITEFGN